MTQEGSRRRPRELVTKVITVPGNLRIACEQFNGRLYFETHETLEEIWQEEQGEVRDLYKGLIQVAAGFVHLTRGNMVGLNRLFSTSVAYLAPYAEEGAMGFDVAYICEATRRCHAEALALGAGNLDQVDLNLAPAWDFDESRLASEAKRWMAWGFDSTGRALEMTITVID